MQRCRELSVLQTLLGDSLALDRYFGTSGVSATFKGTSSASPAAELLQGAGAYHPILYHFACQCRPSDL
jgi:hypothetical protein